MALADDIFADYEIEEGQGETFFLKAI